MSTEILSNARFAEFSIPEQQLGYLTQSERLVKLLQLLKDNGVYDERALYCGVEGVPIKQSRSFGDRANTFAVKESQFRIAVANNDEYNARNEDPLSYATSGSELPALAVFNGACFERHHGENYSDHDWKLKDGFTMDAATEAVIYLTH